MNNTTIAVIGLGYVGLPLAIEFGKTCRTIGFDLSEEKIANYEKHIDVMGEVDADGFAAAVHFKPTSDPTRIAGPSTSSWPCPRPWTRPASPT